MIVRILRPTFIVRTLLLVAVTVVVGWAVPDVSLAGVNPCSESDVQATCQIKTMPIHKGSRGFELMLFIRQEIIAGYGGLYKSSSWVGVLSRRNGHATETDDYSFFSWRDHPLKLSWGGKGTKPLQFAKIKGTFANGRGSIDLTFHATGPARHVSVPKGCRGHGGQRRPGILSGSYTLHADKLGTVTQRSFRATISTASYACDLLTHGYGVQTDASHGLPLLFVRKPSSAGPVSETVAVFRGGKGGSFEHSYTVSGLPSSDFTFNTSKLSNGQVKGAGGISGNATYRSTHSSTKGTTGRMTGSLVVTFASIGKMSPFPRSRAAEEWALSANR
jgi:hypothetical protein